MSITITDLFCGAGGSSSGAIQVPGVRVRMAANHWKLAVDTHNTNHPDADHDCADISQTDPRRYPTTDILWASPECTNHSQAKGRKRVDLQPNLFDEVLPDEAAERSRATMWDVLRFAEQHRYQAIIVENVVDVRDWVMWPAWTVGLANLGYDHQVVYLNSMFAQQVGAPAPQSRDRLYVVAWRKGNRRPDLDRWTRPAAWCPICDSKVAAVQSWKRLDRRHGRYRQQYLYRCPNVACRNIEVYPGVLPAAAAIDWALAGERIGSRARPLAAKTLARIEAGLRRYARAPFITVHRGGPQDLRTTSVDEPLRTLTASGNHLGSVVPPMVVPAGGTWNDSAASVTEPFRTRTTGRKVLHGVHVGLGAAEIEMMASDGYRIATGRVPWQSTAGAEMAVTIAGPALIDAGRTLDGVGEVTIGYAAGDGVIGFATAAQTIVTRLMAEEWPTGVQRTIPPRSETPAQVDTAALTLALKRADLVRADGAPVSLAISQAGITVAGKGDAETGEVVECEYDGADVTVNVNPLYLADALAGLRSNAAEISITDPHKPILLTSPDDPDQSYRHTIQPIRLR